MRNMSMRRPTIAWVALVLVLTWAAGCGRQRSTVVLVEPRDASRGAAAAEQSLGQPGSSEESETAVFPDDAGGKLLAERLQPSEAVPGLASEKTTTRLRFSAPPSLSEIKLHLPSGRAERLPAALASRSAGSRINPFLKESRSLTTGLHPSCPNAVTCRPGNWHPCPP